VIVVKTLKSGDISLWEIVDELNNNVLNICSLNDGVLQQLQLYKRFFI
jgi:hypothetical protein